MAESLSQIVSYLDTELSIADVPDYPGALNGLQLASGGSVTRVAAAVDASSIDQVSIEDAHCLNQLSLLERFANTTVILGVVAVASSKVESADYIAERLSNALEFIDADRLIAAPDCGLMMFNREMAMKKLTNMCEAAHSV